MPLKPSLLGLGAVLTAGATVIAVNNTALGRSSYPEEVQQLAAILERLSQTNDLGSRPIHFMVVSGSYTSYLAEERGFCKEGKCRFFAQLNPYRDYANGWDELIRQSYAFGDIQGWTFSTGTIAIPQATFRAYGERTGYLACTVAHEIAHFKRDHIFKESYHKHHNLKGYSKKNKSTELMRFSRQQELEADRDAADMVALAGFSGRVCQDDIRFMHHSVGDGSATEDDSTHPGYEERLAAMKQHYDTRGAEPLSPVLGRPARLSYDPEDNLLTLTPHRR